MPESTSQGVYLVPGGVLSPGGVCLVPGGVCSGGCTWSRGVSAPGGVPGPRGAGGVEVYLVPGACLLQRVSVPGGVPGPGGVSALGGLLWGGVYWAGTPPL